MTSEIDVLERINAMLSHEENAAPCKDYFTSDVNAACRKAMVDWCFIVCDSFEELNRETVGIAMSILDRYLSSGKGKSAEALRCKRRFQLACITSFYVAVKATESVAMGIEMLLKLCRGYYKENDIVDMEFDILTSLEWRVSLSTTTLLEYVRHFLQLLPQWRDAADVILENAMEHMDRATSDSYFSRCKTSSVAIACFAGAMNDSIVLSPLEKEVLWNQLSRKLNYDIASKEIRKVEQKLLAKPTSCEPRRQSRASLHRPNVILAGKQSSSPVSVLQVS